LSRNLQRGTATDEDDPFIMRLIKPESVRTDLTVGGDALNFKSRLFKKSGKDLLIRGKCNSTKQRLNLDRSERHVKIM